MPERRGSKTANLEIVLEQSERFTHRVSVRREEAALKIETRPPRQHATDVQAFALDLAKHIGGRDALDAIKRYWR